MSPLNINVLSTVEYFVSYGLLNKTMTVTCLKEKIILYCNLGFNFVALFMVCVGTAEMSGHGEKQNLGGAG